MYSAKKRLIAISAIAVSFFFAGLIDADKSMSIGIEDSPTNELR